VGDPQLAPQVEMLVTDGKSLQLQPVADGDSIPMEPPPQGGFVMYIGAAVRNMDACNIKLAGTLRDPQGGAQLGFDARNTNLVLGSDGAARSDPRDNSNEANVNACPDYDTKDRSGGQFILEMKVTDREKRTATATHSVKLVCDPSLPLDALSECVCTCSANYSLGKCNGFVADLSMSDF
jgi:hypothetical protein